MSFQNIIIRRVITAVASVWGLSILALFLVGCIMAPLLPSAMADGLQNYLDAVSDPDATPEEMNAQRDAFWGDFSTPITVQYVLQWTAAVLATFWVARRSARQADSPEQAVGYGALIGGGVALTYGTICTCLPSIVLAAPSLLAIVVLYLGFFVAAGYYGGRRAAPEITGKRVLTGTAPTFGGLPGFGDLPPMAAAQDTTRAQTYFQMGVQAALGARREEARQHFTRVLQLQPRSVPAWLQLANLADTPEQAWNYVQQARALSPNDPAVRDAVAIIWPLVAQSAERREPPRNQPPYPGGQSDDAAVPRAWLPDLTAPETIAPPPPSVTEAPTMLGLDVLQESEPGAPEDVTDTVSAPTDSDEDGTPPGASPSA